MCKACKDTVKYVWWTFSFLKKILFQNLFCYNICQLSTFVLFVLQKVMPANREWQCPVSAEVFTCELCQQRAQNIFKESKALSMPLLLLKVDFSHVSSHLSCRLLSFVSNYVVLSIFQPMITALELLYRTIALKQHKRWNRSQNSQTSSCWNLW